jgi:hypothetical protein
VGGIDTHLIPGQWNLQKSFGTEFEWLIYPTKAGQYLFALYTPDPVLTVALVSAVRYSEKNRAWEGCPGAEVWYLDYSPHTEEERTKILKNPEATAALILL